MNVIDILRDMDFLRNLDDFLNILVKKIFLFILIWKSSNNLKSL